MQHLDVSCAVRRFFKSLGFRGLRHCATSRTVPESIPGSVAGFFSDIFLPTVPWPRGWLSS